MKNAVGWADGDVMLYRAQEQKVFYEAIIPFLLADLPHPHPKYRRKWSAKQEVLSTQQLLNAAHTFCHFELKLLGSPTKKHHVLSQDF